MKKITIWLMLVTVLVIGGCSSAVEQKIIFDTNELGKTLATGYMADSRHAPRFSIYVYLTTNESDEYLLTLDRTYYKYWGETKEFEIGTYTNKFLKLRPISMKLGSPEFINGLCNVEDQYILSKKEYQLLKEIVKSNDTYVKVSYYLDGYSEDFVIGSMKEKESIFKLFDYIDSQNLL